MGSLFGLLLLIFANFHQIVQQISSCYGCFDSFGQIQAQQNVEPDEETNEASFLD
jgi:hypothetical protein